jgi:gliding motility-associated-like protein
MTIRHLVHYILLILFLTSLSAVAGENVKSSGSLQNKTVQFIENKGQMIDDNLLPVPFVLFRASTEEMNLFITEKGLTYSFVNSEEKFERDQMDSEISDESVESKKEIFEIKKAWINLTLPGSSIKRENIIKENPGPEYFNYFYPHCQEGVYNVKGYQKIVIKEVYPGIDWILYINDEKGMKYDFVLKPGAKPEQIKLLYECERPPSIDNYGRLVIETAIGRITEEAPVCFIPETKVKVKSSFYKKIIDKNFTEISFVIGSYGKSALVIDPRQVWGTFFSGTSDQGGATSMHVDSSDNLFITGYTNGLGTGFPLMNAGTYYSSTVSAVFDLFILKFSGTGSLLWGTYYGGSGNERALYEFPFITTDLSGNVFVTGQTTSTDFPVQNAGTFYDSTFTGASGQYNSFILKFDNAGNRIWGTYFGDNGIGFPGGTFSISAATDNSGNLFITGYTNTTSGFPLQSNGTAYFDNSNNGASDIFISKFTNSGNLIWSTYFGGSSTEYGYGITTDLSGNVFITGYTQSSDFPTQNSGTYFDNTLGSNQDAIMIKFDNAGNLLWSTYFGGTTPVGNIERALSIDCDASDNIFIYGVTSSSDFPLKNNATYYDSLVNGEDMFISKFDNSGNLMWSTFIGGSVNPLVAWDFWEADGLAIDNCGNVYITYDSGTADTLFDPGCGSYIDSSSVLNLLEFSNSGELLWSTRIGSGAGGQALRFVVATDNNNGLYYAHEYNAPVSNTGVPLVVLPGAYNNSIVGPSIASNHDDFLLKFIPVQLSTSLTSTDDACGCTGTAALTVCGVPPFTYQWSGGQTSQNVGGLCAGNYSVIVSDNNCGSVPDTLSVVINSLSTLSATVSSTPTGCTTNTGTATVFPTGGISPYNYLWTPSGQTSATATALDTGTYNVLITDSAGCTHSLSIAVGFSNPPSLTILSQSNTSCDGISDGFATVTVSGGSGPFSYSWSSGDTNATADSLTAGTHTCIVTDANGCSDLQSVIITSPPPILLSVTTTQTSCSNNTGSANVNSSGGAGTFSYLWNPGGQTTASVSGLGAGLYLVTITDSAGCSVSQSVNITQVAGPVASAGNNVTIEEGTSTTLIATGGGTYLWNNGETTASISVSPNIQTEYCVTVTDFTFCSDTSCVTVFVEVPCPSNENLSVPNAFSPNGDGSNDDFCLLGWTNCINGFLVNIYDRWGEKVFESGDPAFCWDGTYRGKQMDAAVFVYYITAELTNGHKVLREGNISLLR